MPSTNNGRESVVAPDTAKDSDDLLGDAMVDFVGLEASGGG